MNYLKQLLYELKNQKMVTWVSITGTSLAIFLIMAIGMSDRMVNISISPESNRYRILKGQSIDFESLTGSSGSSITLDHNLARKLYSGLDGVELESYVSYSWNPYDVAQSGKNPLTINGMEVDANFWKMYDYKFISGAPFTAEEIDAGINQAIITETVARDIFNNSEAAGLQLDIDGEPYTIKGVVEDGFTLLPDGNMSIFKNYKTINPDPNFEGIFGLSAVRLLLKEGVNPDYIKEQVKNRYDEYNREMKEEGKSLIYHSQPYTSEELTAGSFGSNGEPHLKYMTRLKGLVYIILLVLPAINLSSMTQSRLQKRISEIGVRRAFGAKKSEIIIQIFTENLLISLIGGILGLLLGLVYLAFLSDFFITVVNYRFESVETFKISSVIWHIFDFSIFFIAFGACFVLNLLSAFIPAWRAVKVSPAIAINKSRI